MSTDFSTGPPSYAQLMELFSFIDDDFAAPFASVVFPTPIYRAAFDELLSASNIEAAISEYFPILMLACEFGETEIEQVLTELLQTSFIFCAARVRDLASRRCPRCAAL